MDEREREREPLLLTRPRAVAAPPRLCRAACLATFLLGCTGLAAALGISYSRETNPPPLHPSPAPHIAATTTGSAGSVKFSVLQLSVWGSPGSFGTEDKELRIGALAEYIGNNTGKYDAFLLTDLWMRPDHQTVRLALPPGYTITGVEQLAPVNCDGVIAPEFCSGMAIVSKHKIKDVQFHVFTNHGDALWDYEYFLRRGVGRVRLEPQPGTTVDLLIASLASIDYNTWYREHQVAELLKFVTNCSAQHVILAATLNVDPRAEETTYKAVHTAMTDALEEFYNNDPTKYLAPSLATLGNSNNAYTEKGDTPVVYDYIWYVKHNTQLTDYSVLDLRTKREELSFSNHMAITASFALV